MRRYITLELTMLKCPHCHRRGVPALGKLLSAASAPVRCKLCGGFSHRSSAARLVAAFGALPAAAAALYGALLWSSAWPLVVLLLVLIASEVAALAIPGTATSRASAKRVRAAELLGLGALLVAAVLYGVLRP
jgi:hypothetical protein